MNGQPSGKLARFAAENRAMKIQPCRLQMADFRRFLAMCRETMNQTRQILANRWETAPRPLRWVLGAFVVLFVVGPITGTALYLLGKGISRG